MRLRPDATLSWRVMVRRAHPRDDDLYVLIFLHVHDLGTNVGSLVDQCRQSVHVDVRGNHLPSMKHEACMCLAA